MRAVHLAAVAATVATASAGAVLRPRDLVPPQQPRQGWEYLGCFVDSVAERVLDEARHYDTAGMTGESCVEFCADAGFKYAGTEWSVECFCGNDRPASEADAEDCSMACSGDEEQPCGGSSRISIYTSDLMAPAVSGWSYAGCFEDSVTDRVLTGAYYADTEEMTWESCIAYCSERDFPYAGNEYGAECFCGSRLPPSRTPDDECSFDCPGDPSKKCGAGNRITLFTSGPGTTPPEVEIDGWSFIGCIEEGDGGRVLTHQAFIPASTMTNELCVAACAEEGYALAGTEYAGECWCGNVYENDGGDLAPASECNMNCLGMRSQKCGGPNRLSAWSRDAPSEEPSGSSSSAASSATSVSSAESSVASSSSVVSSSEVSSSSEPSSSEASSSAEPSSSEASSTEASSSAEPSSAASSSAEPSSAVSSSIVESSSALSSSDVVSSSAEVTPSETTSSIESSSSDISSSEVSSAESASTVSSVLALSSSSEVESSSTESSSSASATPSEVAEGWAYVGCYIDPPGRAMAPAPNSPSRLMTNELCIATCSELGFKVAGTQYTEECFCGDALNNGASETAESDCNMVCAGDSSQFCGAGNRLSLWSNGDFPIWPVPIKKVDDLPGDWEYKGCVFDNANPYLLEWLYEDAPNYATSNMTIEVCLERCQRFGYSAGGVEYGRQCVCGDLRAVEDRGDVYVSEGLCSMPCPGDRTYTCGSGNHISYYEWTGAPLNTFHYASGDAAGRYEFFSTSPIVPLISSVGINDKVIFVEKHGTSLDDTEGSFEFDYATNTYRELALKTDVFCSASFTLPDKAGRMINIGGWSAESIYGVRFFTPDSPQGVDNGTNVWEEDFGQLRLFDPRWYPTAIILSNGSLLAMGGESGSDAPIVPTCEVLPHPPGVTESTYLDYLARAEAIGRTNSYPYLAVLPSGNLFFAQFNESRIISQETFQNILKLDDMPGSLVNPLTGRNYPLQGTMMLMPQHAPYEEPLKILLCGGTTHEPGNDALDNCVSIRPDVPGAKWEIERMPSKRVMPSMTALPDGRYLITNGAQEGRGGFGLADHANLNAVMYDPEAPIGERMTVLANTTIPRMYHSETVLLSDGKVLISGSDPQDMAGRFAQEYRLEYFLPDYLTSGAPQPEFSITDRDWAYGETYTFTLDTPLAEGASAMRVSLMASIGSTHGITMGQRTLFPAFSCEGNVCEVEAPPNAFVSPPSWYQMFVLDGPTPSHAIWVRIGGDPARLGDWPQLPGFTTPGV